MSKLLDLRKAIRTVLTTGANPLWEEAAVIIRRRTKIWNDVAIAVENSRHRSCLVVGVAKGDPDRSRKPKSRLTIMDVTVPVTLIELPQVDPEGEEEDELWEATVMALQGNDLGRVGTGCQHDFAFDGFDEVPDDKYVIRQTLFRTRVILNPDSP
ncbi:hypothetical protein [Haloferula sargassicola]|uniref:Tail terminator n=1 Tax=Haloferula sargassicola TaxID=490096 RepID=A0ABP9UNZ4_9BACT